MKTCHIAPAILLGLLAGSVQADDLSHLGDIYIQGGTQGAGVGYAMPLTSWLGVHADINGFGLSHRFTSGGNSYDAHLHMLSGGTYLDFYPFSSSGFRITAGALFDDDTLSGNAVPTDGTYTFNGLRVVAPPGTTANATIKYPSVMPYFGIGFGHKPVATPGFGFTADLGAAYGNPRVDYNVSPALVALAGANNVAAEEQSIRDTAHRYRFYPIVQVGVSYRF